MTRCHTPDRRRARVSPFLCPCFSEVERLEWCRAASRSLRGPTKGLTGMNRSSIVCERPNRLVVCPAASSTAQRTGHPLSRPDGAPSPDGVSVDADGRRRCIQQDARGDALSTHPARPLPPQPKASATNPDASDPPHPRGDGRGKSEPRTQPQLGDRLRRLAGDRHSPVLFDLGQPGGSGVEELGRSSLPELGSFRSAPPMGGVLQVQHR